MQFSIKRLFILTFIVALLFGDVGQYWPLGTAVAVVVSVATGAVLLAFGTIKSWKLVVWISFIFLGSLVSIRYALHARHLSEKMQDWPDRTIEAIVLLVGAIVSGIVITAILMLVSFYKKSSSSMADITTPNAPQELSKE